MIYQEKLKDPLWQNKRLEILARDSNKCRICKSNQNLNVHHTIYFPLKQPWEYENNYLITLCENCHLDVENNIDKIKHLLSFIQQERPWYLDNIRVLIQRELSEESFEKITKMKFKHG